MSSETFILLMSDDWSRFPDLGSGFREVIGEDHSGPKGTCMVKILVVPATPRMNLTSGTGS
jgi:hypothetical protein